MATLQQKSQYVPAEEHILQEVEKEYSSQFLAAIPFQGLICAIHKKDVHAASPKNDYVHGIVKLDNGLGFAKHTKLLPGLEVPVYGNMHKITDDQIDLTDGDNFLEYGIVISGIDHLTKQEYVNVNLDTLDKNAMKNVLHGTSKKASISGPEFERYGAFGDEINLRTGNVDTIQNYANEIFQYFPTIEVENQSDYVLYIIGTGQMFIAAIISFFEKNRQPSKYVAVVNTDGDPKKGPCFTVPVGNPQLAVSPGSTKMMMKPLYLFPHDKTILNAIVEHLRGQDDNDDDRQTYLDSLVRLTGENCQWSPVNLTPLKSVITSLCSLSFNQTYKVPASYGIKTGDYSKAKWQRLYNILKGNDAGGKVDDDCTKEQIMAVAVTNNVRHHCVELLKVIDPDGFTGVEDSKSPYGKHRIAINEINGDKVSTMDDCYFTLVATLNQLSPNRTEIIKKKQDDIILERKNKPVKGSREFKSVKCLGNDLQTRFDCNWLESIIIKHGMNYKLFELEVLAPLLEHRVTESLFTEEGADLDKKCSVCKVLYVNPKKRTTCICMVIGSALCVLLGEEVTQLMAKVNLDKFVATPHVVGDEAKKNKKGFLYENNKTPMVFNTTPGKQTGTYGKIQVNNITSPDWAKTLGYKKTVMISANQDNTENDNNGVNLDELIHNCNKGGEQLFPDNMSSRSEKSTASMVNRFNHRSINELDVDKITRLVLTEVKSNKSKKSRYSKMCGKQEEGDGDKFTDKHAKAQAVLVKAVERPSQDDFSNETLVGLIDSFLYCVDDTPPEGMLNFVSECVERLLLCIEKKMVSVCRATADHVQETLVDLDSKEKFSVNIGNNVNRRYAMNTSTASAPNSFVSKAISNSAAVLISHVVHNGYQKQTQPVNVSKSGIGDMLKQVEFGIGSHQVPLSGNVFVPNIVETDQSPVVFDYSLRKSTLVGSTTINSPVVVNGLSPVFVLKKGNVDTGNVTPGDNKDVFGESVSVDSFGFDEQTKEQQENVFGMSRRVEPQYEPHSIIVAGNKNEPVEYTRLQSFFSRSTVKLQHLGTDNFMSEKHKQSAMESTVGYLMNRKKDEGRSSIMKQTMFGMLFHHYYRKIISTAFALIKKACNNVVQIQEMGSIVDQAFNTMCIYFLSHKGRVEILSRALMKSSHLGGSINLLCILMELYDSSMTVMSINNQFPASELSTLIERVMVVATLQLQFPRDLRDHLTVLCGIQQDSKRLDDSVLKNTREQVNPPQSIMCTSSYCVSYANKCNAPGHRNAINVGQNFISHLTQRVSGDSINVDYKANMLKSSLIVYAPIVEPTVSGRMITSFADLRALSEPSDLLDAMVENQIPKKELLEYYQPMCVNLTKKQALQKCANKDGFDDEMLLPCFTVKVFEPIIWPLINTTGMSTASSTTPTAAITITDMYAALMSNKKRKISATAKTPMAKKVKMSEKLTLKEAKNKKQEEKPNEKKTIEQKKGKTDEIEQYDSEIEEKSDNDDDAGDGSMSLTLWDC